MAIFIEGIQRERRKGGEGGKGGGRG